MLSRLPLEKKFVEPSCSDEVMVAILGEQFRPLKREEIALETEKDMELEYVRQCLGKHDQKGIEKQWRSVLNELTI